MNGTQWTVSALGRNLDTSLLLDSLFATGSPVTTGGGIAVRATEQRPERARRDQRPPGTAHHVALGVDNGVQGLPPVRVRVAIFDTRWHIENVIVDGTKGLTVIAFPNPAKADVISVIHEDDGRAPVDYVVH